MTRLNLKFPVLLLCLSPFFQPAPPAAAQCCGGGGGGGLMSPDSPEHESSCTAGNAKVTVQNPGTSSIQIQFGSTTMTVPAGQTKTQQLPPSAKMAPGQTIPIKLFNSSGGAPSVSDSASVHWTFPQREEGDPCKKEEKNATGVNESCGVDTKLQGGGGTGTQSSINAKCGGGEDSNQNPEDAPTDPQGTQPPCPSAGTLYKSGSDVHASVMDTSITSNIGEADRKEWSAGMIIPQGNPTAMASYTNPASLQGGSLAAGSRTVTGSTSKTAWSTSFYTPRGAVTAEPVTSGVMLKFYHPAAYTDDSIAITTTGYPHRSTTIVSLSSSAAPDPLIYTAGGIQTTVTTYDESTGNPTGTRTVTVWSNSGADVIVAPGTSTPAREIMAIVEEGGVVIEKHVTSTVMSVSSGGTATRTVEHRGWTLFSNGIAAGTTTNDFSRTEVYRLFDWGEDLVQETSYPDGKVASYAAIVRDYVWWDSTMGQPSLEGTLKLTTEKHGTVGGSTWNTGAWEANWSEPSGVNTKQVSLKPYKNGSAIPASSDALSILQGYANGSSNYASERKVYAPDGRWLSSEKRLAGVIVASSADTGGSKELSSTTVRASSIATFLTRTERNTSGYFYLQPAVEYKMRSGEAYANDATKMISRTTWYRERLFPDSSAPSNVLLATSSGSGEPPWEVEWVTRREFPETTPSGSGPENDYLIKECKLIDSQSGNILATKRFLSRTDTSSSDVFAATSSTANEPLETQTWTYDALDRHLTRTLNGNLVEEWDYPAPQTTVHIDEKGIKTTEVSDLLGRPVTVTLHGLPGQNDVVTTWSYTPRPSGKSGQIVTIIKSGDTTWTRTTVEETDGLGRKVRSKNEANEETFFTYSVANATGEITEKTTLNSVDQEIHVSYRDGQKKSRSGAAVLPESYDYAQASYVRYFYVYASSTVGTNLIASPRLNGMGIMIANSFPISGSGGSTTYFTETCQYDSLNRLKSRSIPDPTGTPGVLYEVYKCERISDPIDPAGGPGSYAYLSAHSTDNQYDDSLDTNRIRVVMSYVKAAPYGGATQIWWRETAGATGAASSSWEATAKSRRVPLQESAMTINGSASYIPLEDFNDGGLRTIAAENRSRSTSTVVQRTWRHSSTVYQSITWKNGLPVTYTAPELTTGVNCEYSPLREPLTDVSFATYPYWKRVELNPTTGRVVKELLPRRAAGTDFETAAYTYYGASDPNAGRLASVTTSTTAGVTNYSYNGRGQVTATSGSGTYPQEFSYDTLGRLSTMSTWRTVGVPATKATTTWTYAGLTDLVESKIYPDAGLGNRVVAYAYNSAGKILKRTSQRGVFTDYSYDEYSRLKWVDYSDSTPDVECLYTPDSGRINKVREGTLASSIFTPYRTTTYGYRFDGMVTSETITDSAGATVTLGRSYDSIGRQSSLNQSWSQSPTGTITSPQLGYFYTSSHNRFSSVYSYNGSRYVYATMSRLAATQSSGCSIDNSSLFSVLSSFTKDIYGHVTSQSYSGGAGVYSSSLRWDRDRLMARSKSSTSDRWEYRYNAKGEVSQAWKQFNSAVANPLIGEVKSGTGSTYAYDDIGNRINYGEIGRGVVSAGPGNPLVPTDTRATTYMANILNYYTAVGTTTPQYFNVRGNRTAGSTILVNGDSIDTPPSADSGYQEGTTGTGLYFRDEVPNTAPSGTTMPDLYEPVKVTQNGVNLTVDNPVQYIPPSSEAPNYDLDGNLISDGIGGRWTYTWDAADRLIRMESAAWSQPATGTSIPAATVPARLLEFGYDAFGRRIRKKVHTNSSGTWVLATWEAYAYDGWNMIASYKLTATSAPAEYLGTVGGIVQSNTANYIWGPDFGSRLEARENWQAAGGVGGLLMATYHTLSTPTLLDVKVPVMDHMGNVMGVDYVSSSGSTGTAGTAYIYDYDAFGKEVRSSALITGSANDFPFHFSTKFTDGETGLNYYGYRYYDSFKGRWINRDPAGEGGGCNLYGMVNNNSVGSYDFLGLLVDNPHSTDLQSLRKMQDLIKVQEELGVLDPAITGNLLKASLKRAAELGIITAGLDAAGIISRIALRERCDALQVAKTANKHGRKSAKDRRRNRKPANCPDECDIFEELLKLAQEMADLRQEWEDIDCDSNNLGWKDDKTEEKRRKEHRDELDRSNTAVENAKRDLEKCLEAKRKKDEKSK